MFPEYTDYSIDYPAPVFKEKMVDLKQFNDDYTSVQLVGVMNTMENQSIVMSNVLYP